ncbi:MAG: hypothetical protein Q9173_003538 [Seirophora scorigena]
MGICSSCLGGRRKQHKDPETSRLLSDDPYRATYGSRSQNPRPAEEAEADDSRRRERAVLESIAHGMSENPGTGSGSSSRLIVHQDRSGSPPPQTNGFKEDDARAQTLAYRTVKKAHIDKISAPMSSRRHDWKDVKAALG